MSYGMFRVAMDAPTYIDNTTLAQSVAALIANGMSLQGLDISSWVQVIGIDPTMNLANPMIDGYALVDFFAYMYIDPLLPTTTAIEQTLANDIVQQLYVLEGHPANVMVSYDPNTLINSLPQITPIGSVQYLIPLAMPTQSTTLPPMGLNPIMQSIASYM